MLSKLIIVEDDQDLRDYLKKFLMESGYAVKSFEEGISALKDIKKTNPDLVILDLGLPQVGGESICKEIKKAYSDLPVIILTGKGTTADVVKGLNLGADDYISKPFEIDELLARVKARLREKNGDEAKLAVGDLTIDRKTMEVRRGSREIKLTPQEYKLLEYLMSNSKRVLSRDMILNRIWLYSPDIETRVVDVYIGYLRKKIDSQSNKKLIHSIRGFGYTIKDE